ncbi:MotA/TolQ/ExbB proton channel family protein [Colwellia sp. MB02u-18]|uniref:MotA/TolQ/ExbB proton channel family protein n=1 Tax=unclassified Colwellia TaxID=196834 RepID=UPI0015F43C98|nr:MULTISPECIES: MotA/TolQ/ExbB proton channel family protein [unclassified Colwellia]MBA6223819.1 MotA/TolQ/ExbB proton channel family protein [Colwellia sp. MB3u-45]MBA6267474.1 MotA/TolQ/ExbB proton channel family protein [Colwellia sp. MB3u-43]MBA6320000.1 MotA/TolQ/ExbB proton channel family protein [Colwellia sp. MB02u-19]MBA6324930.1 MotA/TolQ/ExbB proton channel family protein [Colwellia sp. MB02u-18]MBA6330611.1 MotA/TolQ/ExbB proton channel family protein [Colwellia sp. MB02u-12]
MKRIKKPFSCLVLALSTLLAMANTVFAKPASDLDDLLAQVAAGQIAQNSQNKAREAQFKAKFSEQDQLLVQASKQRDEQIDLSNQLEQNFQNNELALADQSDALNKSLGELKELFGVLQQVAGDTRSKFETSVISAEFEDRGEFLDEFAQSMGSTSKLASIEEIERLWFELQREMTESGKVQQFTREVVIANGKKVNQEITRVGGFNLIADGKYLEYIDETGTVAELIRQPSERFLTTTTALSNSDGDVVPFALDPTGGSILGLLVQAPDMQERIEQGGAIGYVILGLGLIGLLIAIQRFISLFLTGAKVNRQLKSDQASSDNPLGRVMLVREQNPTADTETLELKLSESILREVPKLSSKLTLIKIISVVAPLIGLLGTVTGMINTFQAITLFGTGDPKLMAGGISQALVTTVLGLVVAIPMVFIFALLNSRSRNIINVLQLQSAGIIAERAEKGA